MKKPLLRRLYSSVLASRVFVVAAVSLLCWLRPATVLAATITYVQGNYATPQAAETSLKVTYTAAQVAGDLNVIAVGWNDSTATVSSVTDTSGNTYALAVGPTVQSGYATQSIYYAKNIVAAAAGANSVTVNFATAAAYPDIRILEYSGADPNSPVDVTATNSGNSATSSSGSVTTTNATDLLFGANLVQSTTTGPGANYTSRLLTQPDEDIAEDRMVTATGSYSATAPITPANPWIMQLVAFRTPTTGGTTPTVTGVSPATGSTAGGTAVTITGTNFATGATVTIGGTAATSVVVVSSTSITATTPAGTAGAATVTVTVGGQSGSLASGFTYIAPPTVTGISPASGSTAGGTAVTITGTNFATGATVTIGGTAATSVVVVSSTSITAKTPTGSAGAATVTVTVSGLSGSLASGFTYLVTPTVTGISPNSGSTAGGTPVTITGTNFVTGATVTIGGTAATTVVVLSSTSITATTPAGTAGAATVTVTVGGQSGSLASGFTYVATPTVTGVAPNSGTTSGGTSVTITGTNFVTGATVTFGGTAATGVVVVSGTSITAKTPAGSAGAVTVTVTVSGQSGSLASGFTYVVIPTVTGVLPNSGTTAGGTAVTITGTNFATGATVTFGGTAATDVVVSSSTSITATTPAGTAGAVTVMVAVSGQSGSLASGFTYVATPTVTGVAPNSGTTAGGTAVTITGTNFVTGATVTFGGTAATNVVVASSTSITATTPAGAAGTVIVTVTVSGQSGSLATGFTYIVTPAVSSVAPNTGTTAGGTAVTVTGTNFVAGATVTFGGTAATSVVVVSSTSITATTPAGTAGAVTVTVTVSGQSGSLASGFTYIGTPTVTSVGPNSGATAGGTAVTITGTNFAAGATLTFGGTAATNVVVVSNTSITATTPAGTAGAVTVTVTNPGALSGSLASGFTYVVTSTTITYVQGNYATPQANETSVTITYTAAQVAGDLNVIAVGWNDSVAAVTAVTDKSGNIYTLAVGPTVQSGYATQSIYYAKNIAAAAAGANAVTVTFSPAAAYPDIRILEYSGADPNSPVDVTVASSGTGATSSSGSVTTTVATDLLFAANLVQSTTTGAGANFTSRLLTQPDGDIAEDRMVTATGSYSATAPITPSNPWIMQMVAFHTPLGGGTTPTVTSVSPNSGTTAGGTSVTITGTNFASGATVTFGGVAATSVVLVSSTSITAKTPAGTAGAVTVTVTASGLSGSLASGFTYIAPPTVTGISPNTGTTAGGTSVTITGTNFATGATVTFGANAATNVVVASSTTITATTPAGSAGAVTVTVTVGGLPGSLASGFTYVAAPTVTGVSPNTGTTAGSTAVTITGTNFVAGATVMFGSTAATNVVVASSTSITATTPAGIAGAATVTVTVSGLSGSLASGFTYVATPTVTSISPNTGTTAGGTSVTITGANFVTGATVTIGGTAATSVVVVSSTSITAKTPAGSAGAATVTVTVSGLSGSLASGFTFLATPAVTGISPSSGSTAGGTAVTITGTNFVTGATVTIGGTAATSVVVVSSTSITATTPAGSAGAATVTVTVSGLSGSLTSGFTYLVIPTVTAVSPNSGSTTSGTAVTITGTNFAAGATVTFGGNAATNVVVVSATQITATTPTGSAGAVTVTVTNPGGQSGTLQGGFTYVTGTSPTAPTGFTAIDGGPAPTVVTTQSYINTTAQTSHTTAAFNSTGGNFIVVTASCHSGVTFTASDNFGNTYIPIAGPTSANSGLGFDLRTQIWYAPNPFVGPGHTVTIGLSAAQPLVISVIVGSGSNSAAPIDAVSLIGSDNGTQTINVVSPSITTAEINDLLIGFVKVSTSTTPEAGPGFTVQTGATLSNLVAETGLAATAGTYDATFTLSQTESWESAVVAVANNPNQTTLSWTASTESGGTIANYLVERCQGVGCTSFAQIGTTALNTYNDTGLTAATSYSYRVRAEDTNNNIGPYSGVATVTTPTPIPPTPSAPENLTAAGPIVVASQSYLNATALTSGTTAAFNSTGGNLILLAASSPAGVTFTPTDNLGNSWTSLAGPTSTTTGSLMTTQLWYVQNPIVGAGHTVTVGLSTAEPLEMSVIVVANASASSPIDVTSLIGSDNGSETTSVTSPSVTTTGLNDLLIGFGSFSSDFNTGTYASLAGTGFAEQTGGSSNLLVAESGPAATPASRAATFVLGSAQNWQSAVVAAENNPSQTTLSWTTSADVGGNEAGGTISTYLVERCQGAGCTNFSQIGTATGTTYHDTGLTAATSYSYRVRAEDSADIVGPYSGVVSVTTPSSSAPSAPSNLIASADRTGPMILTWTASTSSVGIADYVVERCQGAGCTNFAQIGTSTGTSYTDSAVVSSTIYSYEVQAVDIDGNVSPFSNIATNTTVGTSPPTAPGNLGATAVSASQINLSWTASTSSLGIANYVVQRCQGAGCTNFAQIATPTGTTYSDTGLLAGTSYSYQAEAIDIEGNVSPFSNIASATTLSPVTTITYVQGNYATPQAAESSVTVAFTAAQVAGDLNVVAVGWNDSSAAVTGVTDKSGNTYTLAVGPTVQSGYATQSIYYAKKIVGAAAGANIVTVTFSPAAEYPDVRILEYSGADPNNPVDVTAASSGNSATSSSGSVTTTVPTDLLFAANLVQSTTTGPGASFTSRLLTQPDGDIAEDRMVTTTGSYSATAPIAPANPWIMQMVAFHTALTCTGAPPTAPSNLTATAISSSQINVSWTASTSCYGIASYIVERCQGASCSNFTQIATPTGVTFTDTGLAANTSYTYQVQAMDNSGNLSAFATPATATTLAISISPRFSALTFTQTQQFTSSAGVTWSVDGVTGGSTTTGTISTTGLYTPPSAVGTHTVTATTSSQQSASATVYITNYPGTYTYHNDNLRTGQNLSETVLTYSNVNQNQFGKLFSYPLDGMAFASPLYVASVNIPGQGYHNVVYVATENDSIYAFDADGLSTTPLWHTSFLSSGVTPIPCADVGGCGDIPIQIGITSTPVIDPTTGTIYVVAATMEGAGVYVQRLHALDITTGLDKFGGPVVIQGSVPGTGEGSTSGSVPFNSLVENQRPGLLLNNGVVYLGFGSHNDTLPWHGWVLGYNATTLAQTMQFNATPNGYGGGIWQSGGGLAADQNGNIYFSTSNGPFDVNTGGVDYGDSIMQITPSGTVGGYFTPYDQANMGANNLDLGAAGPVLLVNQTTGSYPHLLISAGKTGTIYVINRDNMGGYNANNNDQIVQYLQGVLPNGNDESGNFSQPVYYNGYVYFGAVNDAIKAFQLTNGLLSTAPTSQTAAIYEVRGASFAISANGTSNGILWALQNNGTSADTDNTGNPGVLFAYNANNLGTELYDSTQAGSRDTLDLAAKFSIPLVANGKVFIAGQTRLTVFGLLP